MTITIEKKRHGQYRYLAYWFVDGVLYTMYFRTIKDIKEYTATWEGCKYLRV